MEENDAKLKGERISNSDMFVDFTRSFTTEHLFATRDELLDWVRSVGKSLGMVIVIARSDNRRRSGKQYCMLMCEKSERYKSTAIEEGTNSRKCCCEFRLKGKLIKKLGGSILRVMRGTHNHALISYNEGHLVNSRLIVEEKEVVTKMAKNLISPKLILNKVKATRPNDNHTTLKQIYNFCSKQRASLRQDRIEIQQLMHLLERDQFVCWHRAAPDTNVVKDIFWAHSEFIELLSTFPIVLCIDSTYKTNRYKFPLIEIVGVNSTERTFSVAFAYVHGEKIDNLAWVLEKLKSLFRRQDEMPKVILTDRDIGIMNALASVFPSSANLLCQFHIKKNVRAKARMLLQLMELVEDIMCAFQRLVHAKTTEEYEWEFQEFVTLSAPFPNFLNYVNTTWLDPYKERFIDVWINE